MAPIRNVIRSSNFLSPFSHKESGVYRYCTFGGASLSAIRELSLRKQQENKRYRFLVDGMLGSLAIKLRILGFDTVYNKTSSDAELLESTASSSRHLLTSDVDLFLFARRKHLRATLISSRDELGRVAELYTKARDEKNNRSKSFQVLGVQRNSCAH